MKLADVALVGLCLANLSLGAFNLKKDWDIYQENKKVREAFEKEFAEFKRKRNTTEEEALHLMDSLGKMSARDIKNNIDEWREVDSEHMTRRFKNK